MSSTGARIFTPGQTGGTHVTIVKNLWPAIRANIALAAKSIVAVGFPGENPKTQDVEETHNGMTNAQVAIANELGSAPFVLPVVPSRPFIGTTLRYEKKNMLDLATKLLAMIVRGEMSTAIALGRMGKDGADKVQATMVDSKSWAVPNSEITKAIKGSSTPLIDTEALRQAVTYKVRMVRSSVPRSGRRA